MSSTRVRGAQWLWGLALLALFLPSATAQYVPPYVTVQGFLSTSGGTPAQNATLTFQLSQVAFVAGTQVVVQESQCATDTSGNVVEIGNPVTGPIVTPQFVGTLPPGNYYVKFSWYDQFNGETLPSPEVIVNLTAAGELQITPPAGSGPPSAVGMRVYIGTSPGAEQLQGQTATPTTTFTQAEPLTAGRTPLTSNTTVCRVVANDSMWPTGTGYQVSLLDASGNTLFAYPEMWQFFGPGSTYNLSQGIPYYHGQVTYPTPVLTIPYNHNVQSISGPLALGAPGNYYNLVGVAALGVDTMLPAWGVDVEGAGLLGEINAVGGFLANGIGGALNQCLGSNGTAFNTPINCVTTLPTLYYQVVLNGSTAASAVTERGYLAVGAGTGLVASDAIGVGSQVSRTVLAVNATGTLGTDTEVVNSAGAGAPGSCAQWDSVGGLGSSGSFCAITTPRTCNVNGCYQIQGDGTITLWMQNLTLNNNTPTTITLPHTIPTAVISKVCSDDSSRVQSGNDQPVGANFAGLTAPFSSMYANTPATGMSASCVVVGY